jgi:hypothetical protein
MRKPDYWEPQEVQEQYAEWLKTQPPEPEPPPLDPIAKAVVKARGDILTEEDMAASIGFLNRMAAKIKRLGNIQDTNTSASDGTT